MGVSAEPAFLQGERAGVCSAAHGWCCAQGEEGGILALNWAEELGVEVGLLTLSINICGILQEWARK